MTHLRIEQSTSGTEQVSSNVILKIYDLVHDGNLDLLSDLKGRLHSTSTYLIYKTYLEGLFNGLNDKGPLYITADKYYLWIEDPEVRSILASTYGDGTGVSEAELANVSTIENIFVNNTNIVTFNEFKYFTGINFSNYRWSENWFHGCTNLREITIPKNVKNMVCNDGSFKNCTSLLTVTFDSPSSLEVLSGFSGCSNLTNINIPDSVQIIDGNCFYNCSSLYTIDTKNATRLGGSAFKQCSSLTSATILNVEEIGVECFCRDSNLTSINYSNTITTLRRDAFGECSELVINDLSLPNLTTLESGAFSKCKKLKQVSNLGLVTLLPGWVFNSCSQLTSVTLPLTVTSIGENAFYECSALTSIDLSNITSIGDYAFLNCTSLVSININSAVISLGRDAFAGCESLSGTISLPNATTGIGTFNQTGLTEISVPLNTNTYYAFPNSPNLLKITTGTSSQISDYFVTNCGNLEYINFVGVTPQYNSVSNYYEVDLDFITKVSGTTFLNTPKLFKELTIGGITAPVHLILTNLSTCGWACFSNSGMTALTLGNITSGANDLFNGCINLEYLDITRCTRLYSGMFKNCTKLQTILTSNSLTTINGSAFLGCTSLTSFTIPASVTSIESAVFTQCSSLRYLIFEGSTPPSTLGSWGWPNIPVYVPNDAVQAYLTAFAAATNEAIKNNILPISNYNPAS